MAESVLSPTFIIGSIRIGTVEGASCVNFGNNWPSEFTSISKQQQGFGNVSGDHNDLTRFRAHLEALERLESLEELTDEPSPHKNGPSDQD
jgi:hypothetical protein